MIHLALDGQQARTMIRLVCFMNDLLFSIHAPLFLPSSVLCVIISSLLLLS